MKAIKQSQKKYLIHKSLVTANDTEFVGMTYKNNNQLRSLKLSLKNLLNKHFVNRKNLKLSA